ncbi:hypothetical protein ACTQ5K_14445 [Niallia sp. Sow4_A1]|uniref:hypothetical protein n=1 Tax=Bacillaceae TaxID=186817 RepID=UPI000B23F8E5|nr:MULTISPECIES: hypothetical protein [unclassified Bacillus (in: firmicutes)]
MEMGFVHLSAIIVAIFQVLLSVSYPLGEYVMGGSHKGSTKKIADFEYIKCYHSLIY